ncbi:MAG: glycerophosphodiester phosphodiesterase [Candidatus Latescibacterota bacterium]|nr:MAG: glycerophosphodiester phosphodiesterase [Candidatus Latescibacterota bacterium]HDH99865.1 glycerophosphodiester phosphodiesterase [Bacillota bacterium]
MAILVAHRGYSAVAPENTLAALRAALGAGVSACEVDVRVTSDGELVLMHDETVDRTTDGSGRVRELALSQIRALDAGSWKGEEFRGERVPTLREALEVMEGGHLVVEVKDEGIEGRLARTIRSAGAQGRTTVISFSLETCRNVRKLIPDLGVLWLLGRKYEGAISTALEAGVQGLDVHHEAITPEFAEAVLRRGLSLWAWTVEEPEEAERLEGLGVSVVTSDDPIRLRREPCPAIPSA